MVRRWVLGSGRRMVLGSQLVSHRFSRASGVRRGRCRLSSHAASQIRRSPCMAPPQEYRLRAAKPLLSHNRCPSGEGQVQAFRPPAPAPVCKQAALASTLSLNPEPANPEPGTQNPEHPSNPAPWTMDQCTPQDQSGVGGSTRSITNTSTSPRDDSSFSPSCSCSAVKMDGWLVSVV